MNGNGSNGGRQAQDAPGTRNDRLKRSTRGRRRQARRKETFLIGCAVVLLVAVAAVCFLFLFRVQEIAVTDASQQRYTGEQIAAASGIEIGENISFLKTDEAAARIERTLPYIETASVRRGFPSTVHITVTYARPAVAIPTDGGYIVLNAKGKVLQVGAPAVSDYVAELRGVTATQAEPGENVVFAQEDAFENVTALVGAFNDAGYLNVTAYDVSDLQNILVEVDYKIDVKLGNVNRVEKKLAFGKEVLLRTLENAKRSTSRFVVDLTSGDTAYVRSQRDIDEAASAALTTLPAEADEAVDAAPENEALPADDAEYPEDDYADDDADDYADDDAEPEPAPDENDDD